MEQIFVIQRHGNAEKAEEDMDRVLSERGRQQAEAMQYGLRHAYLAGADVVLSSVAPRAIDTVKLDGAVTALPELYMPEGEDGAEMDRLFAQLGYAPLRSYLTADGTGALDRWAARAAETVRTHADGKRLVRIGCHAVLANALAAALLPMDEPRARNMVLDNQLSEADCILIRVAHKEIGGIHYRISSREVSVEIARSAPDPI